MSSLQWLTLPDDVKLDITSYLYYTDKQSLALCSKADRLLVRNSKWIFDRIDFSVNRDSKKSIEVSHRYREDEFVKKEEGGTLVAKYYRLEDEAFLRWKLSSEEMFENRDFQEMASERLNEMLKAQKWQVGDLNMDLHDTPPTLSHPISVKTIHIQAVIRSIKDPQLLFNLVNSIRPTVDWLQFTIEHALPRGLETLETVRKAKRLVFSSTSQVCDEDLLNFEARYLDIYASKCTKNGVRDFILHRFSTGKPCFFTIGVADEDIDANVITDGFRMEQLDEIVKISMENCRFCCVLSTLQGNRVDGEIRKINNYF